MENLLTNEFKSTLDIDGGANAFSNEKSSVSNFFNQKKVEVAKAIKTEIIPENPPLSQANPNPTTEIKPVVTSEPSFKSNANISTPNAVTPEGNAKLARIYAMLDMAKADLGFGSLCQVIFLKQDKEEIKREFSLDKASKENITDLLEQVYLINGTKKNPKTQFIWAICMAYLPLVVGVVKRLVNPPAKIENGKDTVVMSRDAMVKMQNEIAQLKIKSAMKTTDATVVEDEVDENDPEYNEFANIVNDVNGKKPKTYKVGASVRGRKAGQKKNPNNGKMENPLSNGKYSWQ